MEEILLRKALQGLEPFEDGVALALATEGYSPEKCKLLGFTIAPLGGAPFVTLYVRGGDPSKSGNINQINQEAYQTLALSADEAWSWFIEITDAASFIVSHSAGFAVDFLRKLRAEAGGSQRTLNPEKFLDTLIIARTRGQGLLPGLMDLADIASINKEMATFPNPKSAGGGCGLKAMAEKLEVPMEEAGPLCERNALALRDVFLKMLDQPC